MFLPTPSARNCIDAKRRPRAAASTQNGVRAPLHRRKTASARRCIDAKRRPRAAASTQNGVRAPLHRRKTASAQLHRRKPAALCAESAHAGVGFARRADNKIYRAMLSCALQCHIAPIGDFAAAMRRIYIGIYDMRIAMRVLL